MEEFNPASFTVIELMFPVALAAATATLLALTGGFWGEKYWPTFREIFSTYLFAGIPIALIGYSVGFLTGISRTPAVGSVLPAVLATIGGLSAYAFGTDAKYKFIVGYSASLLVISPFLGHTKWII